MQPGVHVREKHCSRCYPFSSFHILFLFLLLTTEICALLNPLQSGPEFTPWDLATTSDLERNVMGQSTEMSPLVSMLFRTFLNPLKFFLKIFTF